MADDDIGQAVELTAAVVTGVGINNGVLQIVGTNGDDRVSVNRAGRDTLRVHANFLSNGPFREFVESDIDMIRMHLCDGNDQVFTIDSNADIPTIVNGGDGDDILKGGNGSTVLIGDAGSDLLISGKARTILVGGLDKDRLVGVNESDFLIGGQTVYDAPDPSINNQQALLAILGEWNSARPYGERIDNIRNSNGPILGGTGVFMQSSVTVLDDFVHDLLTGSGGLDWFFLNPLDVANDANSDEEVA